MNFSYTVNIVYPNKDCMSGFFDTSSLARPADLPSQFEALMPLNQSLAQSGRDVVTNIFSIASRVGRILQCPQGDLAPVDIRREWIDVVIPVLDVTRYAKGGRIVHGDAPGEIISVPLEHPELLTESTKAISALGLHLIHDILAGEKSIEAIESRYRAFAFWTTFDRSMGNQLFSFRPDTDRPVPLERFVILMNL